MRPVIFCFLACAAIGCGTASGTGKSALSEMEVIRETPGAREGAVRSPAMYEHAVQLGNLAYTASKHGDAAAAALYAERSTAAYHRSLALSRVVRATEEKQASIARAEQSEQEVASLKAARRAIEEETATFEKRLELNRLATVPVARPEPKREAARQVVARALAVEARLLCSSAALIDPEVDGLTSAQEALAKLETQLQAAPKPGQLDVASQLRVQCLSLLTSARQGDDDASSSGQADALFAELSATTKWDPSRDERGVRIVLRNSFQKTGLTADAQAKLEELGRIALSHPRFPLQVVVHDATTPTTAEQAANRQRAQSVIDALIRGGAAVDNIQAELAKAFAPVVDPADINNRHRNARLEIVFIAPDL